MRKACHYVFVPDVLACRAAVVHFGDVHSGVHGGGPVVGRQVPLARVDPHLDEAQWLGLIQVVLAVGHPRAGSLHQAFRECY